jgi:kynureninase
MTTLQHCRALDAADPLRALRDLFALPAGVTYLDGNSLGPLPRATAARVAATIEQEWGEGLIRSWNTAGWFEMPQRIGDRIGQLIGAKPGETVATDTTSVNLYKVLSAALRAASGGPKVVLSERSNFPTDLYIAESLCRERGFELVLAEPEAIEARIEQGIAVLMLTHVNYRTGAMHDMERLTALAHAKGALAVWDLAHSAGAVPVDLNAAGADFAVGCGYKYLNGGPGAPAFLWVHAKHASAFLQPLSGWWGHAAPFEFTPGYRPAEGVSRYLCGTQPVLGMAALDCGLDTFRGTDMAAVRRKSLALTDCFIALVEERCAGHGLSLVTPRDHAKRGSQVCLSRADGAYAIVQALIARGVIGDYRAPDILRFGFTPLYTGFEDVWNAVEHLRLVMETREWQRDEFNRRNAVT